MRILCVIDNLNTGGAQRQMVNLAVGLHECGHTVELFSYAPGDLLAGPLHAASIPILNHLKRSRYTPEVVLALRSILRSTPPDIVLSYLTTPNVYAILAACTVRRRPRIVVSERSYDPPGGMGHKHEAIRQLYRLADHVVVNSQHQRLNFTRKYQWLNKRVTTIYNGVDLTQFQPPECEPADEPFRLLVIGSISPYKNGLCLIEALRILRQEHGLQPMVNWVGQHILTIDDRARYLAQMEQAITEYCLWDQWHWLYQRQDVAELLQQHHALIHASTWEGLPNVVCEALACGRPVIVSNILDHPQLVQDGQSGFLFDWRDPYDLALKIKRLYDLSPVERHALGQNGRQFAMTRLSQARLTQEYEMLFSSLLS